MKLLKIAFLGLLVATLSFMLALSVVARPPEMIDSDLAPWFQSLHNPTLSMSCCDKADGHILADKDWRTVADGYEVSIENIWVPVPKEAVLDRADNPTGSAVAFWLPGSTSILCFVRPSET